MRVDDHIESASFAQLVQTKEFAQFAFDPIALNGIP